MFVLDAVGREGRGDSRRPRAPAATRLPPGCAATSDVRWVLSPWVIASNVPNRITTPLMFHEIVSALQSVTFTHGRRTPHKVLVGIEAGEGGLACRGE